MKIVEIFACSREHFKTLPGPIFLFSFFLKRTFRALILRMDEIIPELHGFLKLAKNQYFAITN